MNNIKTALIYGSDTGITELVVSLITKELDIELDIIEVFTIKPEDFDRYDKIIIGVPTWYDGDLQSDWEDFFLTSKKLILTGKKFVFLDWRSVWLPR